MKTKNNCWYVRIMIVLVTMLPALKSSANIYMVTSTADAGAGTLRQAVLNANGNAGLDTIRFLILVAGNTFESQGLNNYAVIQLNTTLPTITSPVFIDGFSQTDTNLGAVAGRTVGVDNIVQANIPYPDVYIVPSNTFVFSSSSDMTGNCFTIDINSVQIRGLAISGFGNTNSASGTASGNADIMVLRSPTLRNINVDINNNFIGCDPRGGFPTLAYRKSKSNGILVGGFNGNGSITSNYIAHSGTYAIHFNGLIDINGVGPAGTTLQSRQFIISGNQLIDVSTNTLVTSGQVADGVNMMKCNRMRVINNYFENVEQVGVDMGYNTDSNYVANNTITGFVKTVQIAPQAGTRMGLSSQYDTVYKNVIYSNTGANFKAGVWIDRSSLAQTGVVIRPNAFNFVSENQIYSNTGSGIVLSTNAGGVSTNCLNNVLTKNSTYNNTGLGIDLNYNTTAGPTTVTVNDDGDGDAGTNDIQNFPLIDSVKQFSATVFGIYGKCPAGATLEFFVSDGGVNRFGGLTLDYGEGKYYMGTAVEGSVDDAATGTGSYNIDGNVATNNVNMFFVMVTYTGTFLASDKVTATATLANNTSEFGTVNSVLAALGCTLSEFHGTYNDNKVQLSWKAICDERRNFDVQYSENGIDFHTIGNVRTKEEGKFIDYDYTHLYPAKGANYYRLKLYNNGGSFKYSSVVRVKAGSSNTSEGWKIMNTVFQQKVDFTLQTSTQLNASLHLVNQQGKVVRYMDVKATPGLNFFTFDQLASLPAGTYYVYCKTNTDSFTGKVMKQ